MSEKAELRPADAGDAAASLAERVVANLGSAVHASAGAGSTNAYGTSLRRHIRSTISSPLPRS